MEKCICGDFNYSLLEDGNCRITGYRGRDAQITVPAVLDGHPVQEVGREAFIARPGLTAVTLAQGVTHIGEGAFRSCENLVSIALPASAQYAFWGPKTAG